MDGHQLMYNSAKLEPTQEKNKWVSVTFDKTRSSPLQQNSLIYLKGKSTLTIKNVLNMICTESFLWNLLIICSIWLNFILVTYTYIFTRPKSMNFNMFSAILIFDLLFILDVARSSAIFYGHLKLGRRATDKRQAVLTYLDIFLALPIDYSLYYFYRHLNSEWFIGFRLISTLRAYRIFGFIRESCQTIGFHHTIIAIAHFLSIFGLVVHTLTCLWHVNSAPLFNEEDLIANDYYYYYAMCCAFSTISHFGYGFQKIETATERFIACKNHINVTDVEPAFLVGLGMIFGYLLVAVIFVPTIWKWFHLKHLKRIVLTNQKQIVLNHLQAINCDVNMLPKTSRYFNMFWRKKYGTNKPENIFSSLNDAMQENVHFDKNYKILKESVIFRDFPESYLRRISRLMKHEFFSAKDFIFSQNCVKDKMICVAKGIIDISSLEDSNCPIISFGAGTFISECSLVLRLLSKTAVKAATYVELQVIYREDFHSTIRHYPEQYASILTQINKRIILAEEKRLSDTSLLTTEATCIEKLKHKTQACVQYKIGRKLKLEYSKCHRINLLWRFIVSIFALYVAIAYPYHICFIKSNPGLVGSIAEILFILDIFVSIFKRGFKYKGANKDIIWKTSNAMKCLERPYFYLNILSAFPFELFALVLPVNSKSSSSIKICLLLKLNRLFKVYKIHLLLKFFELKFKLNICYLKVARVLVTYILIIHWTGSLLYFIACYNNSCFLNGWFANKTREENVNKLEEPLTRNPFALSIYFATCVLSGIEIGDLFPLNKMETVITGALIFLGIILRGVALAIFIAALSLSQTSKLTYQTKLYKALSAAKKYFFPDHLKQRIINFHLVQSLYNKDISIERSKPIELLPKNLQKEIRLKECLDTLKSVKMFSDFNEEFSNWVAYNARLLVLPPKEIVLYQGSTTKTLYILQKGFCYEKHAGNSVYTKHGSLSVFGYNSFLFSIPEQSQVITSTHCQFVLVDSEVLKMANVEFPPIMDQIRLSVRNSLAGGDVNYDVRMLESTLHKDQTSKLHRKQKKCIYKLTEDSFTNMRKYCQHREDYFRPFLKFGNYQCLKHLLIPFTINPHGAFFYLLTYLRLLIALAYGILSPIQYVVAPYHPMLHLFLLILDCIMFIDLYIRFHVSYYDKYDQLVRHPYSTARNYFKGQFLVDIVVCFPFEWLLYTVWGPSHNEAHSEIEHNATLGVHALHCSLRLIRMLQLYNIILFLRYCEKELRLKKYVLAVCTYFCACLVLVNAWACVFIVTNCTYTANGSELNPSFSCHKESWYTSSIYGKHNHFADVYIAAIYFVTTVSMSAGFGDISPKMFQTLDLTIVMIVTNWIIITYLVAKIIASSQYSSVKRIEEKNLLVYQNKLKELMMYLKNDNVSVEIQRQLENYLHYVWSRSCGIQNLEVLVGVNDSLLQDCVSYIYEDTLKKIPIFRRMGRAFYRTIGQKLKEVYFLKNQCIIRSQDVVHQIYIIKNGKVDFFDSDDALQFTMGSGGSFGNFTENKMTIFSGLIIAKTNVDLLVLTSEDFIHILNVHPLFKKRLENAMGDVREYYMSPEVTINDVEILRKGRKYGFNIPLFAYHNKFQYILLMKAHIKNGLDHVFLFAAYLNCFLILYQFSFQDISVKYILAAIVIDVIFIFKMCLAFNRPLINRFGDTIRQLQSSYFTRKLNRSLDIFINLSSITSYLIFYLPFHNVATAGFTIWRLICLLRIYYIIVFFRKKNKDILANKIVITICAVYIWFSLIIHTCACLWYTIVCPFATCPNDIWGSTVATAEPFEMYVASLYFIICLFTSTAMGDILPRNKFEMIFIVILILISQITNAIVLAELAKDLYMEFRVRYENEIKDIRCYLKQQGVKKYQVNKVLRYFKNIWKYSYGNRIPGIILELPTSIKTDLLWTLYGRTFKDSYIFSKTEEPFLRHLVLLLDIQIYFENDYVTRDSTIDERVFFIYKGEVSIVTHYSNQTDAVHDTLHTGDVFGLGQGLFAGVPHHFSFRANATTEILSLKLDKWKYLLGLFPTSKRIIYDRIENVYI